MYPITTQRLQNQQIEYPRLEHPAEILSWLGALQGQDYSGAKWSIGLRLPNSTDVQIEQAIADNKIVRTWLMRGTLFLLAAEDLRWMLELLAPRVIQGTTRRYRELELDDNTLNRSRDIIVKALEGRKQRTRRELLAILEENGISKAGQRGIHMLQYASMCGLIFQGTVQNNNPAFMLLDEYLPEAKPMTREEALAQLAQRYFISRAPATLHDFAWWGGLTMADARTGLEGVKHLLIEESIDGTDYWLPQTVSFKAAPDAPTVYTPPGFDEYLLGYKVRDAMLDPQHAEQVCPGKNGVFYPTIVRDGQMIGTWKRTVKSKKIIVEIQPFAFITKPEIEAFTRAIQRFGDFHQMPVEVLA